MPEDRDSNNPNNSNTNNNPNNRSDMPQNQDWDNESNPFVAFRRFADEQVSSVLQSITGLPSSINPPQPDNWTIFTDDKGYKSMAYRHRSSANNAAGRDSTQNSGGNTPGDGEDDSSKNNSNNNDQNPPSRSQQSPHSENTQQPPQPPSLNRQRNEGRPADFFGLDSFFDRFEDRFFPFASSFLHPHHNFFSADMFDDSNSPTWPLTYVMLSPYSPLHLERQAQYRMHRDQGVFSSIMSSLRFDLDSEPTRDPSEPQWREAFEDLLRLENGKPMLERDSLATTKTRPENGIEWVHGLVKRGSLGDKWKYVSGTERHPWTGITFSDYDEESQDREEPEPNTKFLEKQQAAHDEAEAETELELYERFLQDIEAREHEFSQEIASSPLLRGLLEEQQRRRNAFQEFQRDWPSDDEQGNDDTESWLDLVSGGNRKSVPETKDATSSVSTAPAGDQQTVVESEKPTARVISTMINTERTHLPDGSVQTKKVTTKRYEDGREETESLVETTHPRNEEGPSNDENSGPKNGWFWKD